MHEKIGSQAKAPAPIIPKSLCVDVGQTLSSAKFGCLYCVTLTCAGLLVSPATVSTNW